MYRTSKMQYVGSMDFAKHAGGPHADSINLSEDKEMFFALCVILVQLLLKSFYNS